MSYSNYLLKLWYFEESEPQIRLAHGILLINQELEELLSKNVSGFYGNSREATCTQWHDYPMHAAHHAAHHAAQSSVVDTFAQVSSHNQTPDVLANKLSSIKIKLSQKLRLIDEKFGCNIQSPEYEAATFIVNRLGTKIIKFIRQKGETVNIVDEVTQTFKLKRNDVEHFLTILYLLKFLEEAL